MIGSSRIIGFIAAFILVMSFTACSDDDDLEVEFFLTNDLTTEAPEPVTEFRFGEDIGFILRLWNTGDKDVDVGYDRDIIGNDIFTVYKGNGEIVGKPWKDMGVTFEGLLPIYAGSFKQWQAVWKGVTTRSAVLFPNEDNEPLAVGSYYCHFIVRLPERSVVCHQRFSVIP